MKILVLGGTGAMGRPLVSLLAKDKLNKIVVTSRTKREGRDNVTYIQGNAKDLTFLKDILTINYDAIVDFMVYNSNEFRGRFHLFLNKSFPVLRTIRKDR